MRSNPGKQRTNNVTRRDFLKTSAAVSAAAAVASSFHSAYAQGTDVLRIGLIGCGGRGRGAATDAMAGGGPGVQLVALGDMFQDQIDETLKLMEGKPQVKVAKDKCFVGFDAYKKVLECGVDYVILATPPAFRPFHIKAAAEAGKHIFAEKPCGVDPAGIRMVLEAAAIIDQKKTGFVGGTQRRHERSYMETMKKLEDGAIGRVIAGQAYWMQGSLRVTPRKPEWTDLEWQLRNWWYFTWLSGDTIVEQAMHQVDVMNWVMGGPPKSALAIGGRQVRTGPEYGNVYDQFAVEYEYPGGQRAIVFSRQIDKAYNRITENAMGTKGSAFPQGRIKDEKGETTWTYEGEGTNQYEDEHKDLIESIRKGQPINEAKRFAESTLTAIMGRMSAYTGQIVAWTHALNRSKLSLFPEKLDLQGKYPTPPVAMPGTDPLT